DRRPVRAERFAPAGVDGHRDPARAGVRRRVHASGLHARVPGADPGRGPQSPALHAGQVSSPGRDPDRDGPGTGPGADGGPRPRAHGRAADGHPEARRDPRSTGRGGRGTAALAQRTARVTVPGASPSAMARTVRDPARGARTVTTATPLARVVA